MIDNKKLWDDTLVGIESTVSEAIFGTWFRNTNIIKQELGNVYLGVPNAFVKDWLQNKYHKFILKLLRDISPDTRSIEYIITKSSEGDKPKKEELFPKQPLFTDGLGLQDLYINKDDNLNP